jgi:hypothetical protein
VQRAAEGWVRRPNTPFSLISRTLRLTRAISSSSWIAMSSALFAGSLGACLIFCRSRAPMAAIARSRADRGLIRPSRTCHSRSHPARRTGRLPTAVGDA